MERKRGSGVEVKNEKSDKEGASGEDKVGVVRKWEWRGESGSGEEKGMARKMR